MKEKMSFWRNGVKLSKDQLNIAIRNIKYDVYPCETNRYKINKAVVSDNTYAVWKTPLDIKMSDFKSTRNPVRYLD